MDILCIVPALPFSGVSSVGNLHLSYIYFYYHVLFRIGYLTSHELSRYQTEVVRLHEVLKIARIKANGWIEEFPETKVKIC